MAKIYTFPELKESKLIYDRKTPSFGVIMTLMTLIFLIAAIVWAALSVKTYVVKATGLVTDENKLNIMNTVSAEVKTINVVEGQTVKQGDILLTLDGYQVELQIQQLSAMVELYQTRAHNTNKLVAFVNGYLLDDATTQVNPFDADDPSTSKLYADAETFISYVKSQQEAASGNQGGTTPDEGGTDGGTDGGTETEPFTQEKLDEVKGQYLSQQGIYSSLDEYMAQVTQYNSQIAMYSDSLEQYTVRATQDGVIHLTAGLTVGTMLQAGTLLGNITSGNQDNLQFDTTVSATDRSKLTVGSTVEIAVGGVMQTDYGVLTGKVTAISTDSTQTEDGNVYYVVTVRPDSTQLTDKKGNKVNLTVGMIGEVRIKYDQTTWLNWMIEQIGIKFN